MPHPGGRPTELTPQLIAEVAKVLPTCLYRETVADYLGVDRSTFWRWVKRGNREIRRLRKKGTKPRQSEAIYVEFCNAIKKALAEGEIFDLDIIKKASEKNWQAAAWRRERRNPERWGRKDRMDQEIKRQVQQQYEMQGLVEVDKIMEMWRGALEAIRTNVHDPTLMNAIIKDVLQCIPRPTRATLTYARPANGNGDAGNGETTNGEG
jgi:hypothetical protein